MGNRQLDGGLGREGNLLCTPGSLTGESLYDNVVPANGAEVPLCGTAKVESERGVVKITDGVCC